MTHKIVDSADGISICGKRSGGWVFQFHNSLDCSVSLEYSTQMVTYAYASSWSGISDVSIIGVGSGSVVMFQVDEHALCGFVSFRINYGSMSRYVYANELSTDCSWSHFSRDENNDDYLSIENMGKTNNRWCLRIGNPKSFRLQVTYNSKMCFGTDARDWSGLNDQVNLAVGARSFAVVYVSTNLFAGYVTACYCDLNGRRFVTYANSLTQSGGITVYHNVI
ncbi:MAG: hypothetical protein MJ238_06690 [Bacilli bacterium]|nr:hypothetical protein [Bacilli bacterium]